MERLITKLTATFEGVQASARDPKGLHLGGKHLKASPFKKRHKKGKAGTLKEGHVGEAGDEGSQDLDQDATWIMIGISSIAAALQFGSEQSPIRKILQTAKENKPAKSGGSNQPRSEIASLSDKMRTMEVSSEHSMLPPEAEQALQLLFAMLVHCCRHLYKPADDDPAICPYVPLILTFLATILQARGMLELVGPYVPWMEIVDLYNKIPVLPRAAKPIVPNSSNKLFGTPLPEDWCIRGMEWTGKQLFGRGYFKSKFVPKNTRITVNNEDLGPNSNLNLIPQNEFDVLDERFEGSSMPTHAGGPNVVASLASNVSRDGDSENPPPLRETIGQLRWKRIALTASWLTRAVPGLHLVEESGKVEITPKLQQKIDAWEGRTAAEDCDTHADTDNSSEGATTPTVNGGLLADAKQPLSGWRGDEEASESASNVEMVGAPDDGTKSAEKSSVSPGPAVDVPSAVTTRSKADLDEAAGAGDRRRSTTNDQTRPGFTTLVFDTNALLNSFDLFVALLESKQWTMIIPLAGEGRNFAPSQYQDIADLLRPFIPSSRLCTSHHRAGRSAV